MEKKFDQISYQNEYNKKKYDRTGIMLPHADTEINLEAVKNHASSRGESVNAFVIRAIREQMKRDKEENA